MRCAEVGSSSTIKQRAEATLLRFPQNWLAQHEVASLVPTSAAFENGSFDSELVAQPLDALEPIFVLPHDSGRLLESLFANDLFAAEDAWIDASERLVLDASNPATAPRRPVVKVAG